MWEFESKSWKKRCEDLKIGTPEAVSSLGRHQNEGGARREYHLLILCRTIGSEDRGVTSMHAGRLGLLLTHAPSQRSRVARATLSRGKTSTRSVEFSRAFTQGVKQIV